MSEPRSSGQESTPITIGPWRILHEHETSGHAVKGTLIYMALGGA